MAAGANLTSRATDVAVVLEALLGVDASFPVWVASDVPEGALALAHAQRIDEPELIPMLSDAAASGTSPTVLVVHRVDPPLARQLRAHPVALLVVTGQLDGRTRTGLERIDGLHLLGGEAVVRLAQNVDAGAVLCAPDVEELEGLWRAFGGQARLALSPTPAWLPRALAGPTTRDLSVAGYVSLPQLDAHWVHWSRSSSAAHVIVPVGIPTLGLEELQPKAPQLEAITAAHTLERFTGPVFPAPRVLALVLERLESGNRPAPSRKTKATSESREASRHAFWAQARRALPMTGAVLGMEQPPHDLPLDSPTAAFLAQRTLLRIHASRTLGKQALALSEPDADGIQRSIEVLRSAGQVLTDQESKVVLRGFGLEVTRQAVSTSASGAVGFAERIGYPVVLKALSPDLRRRSDIGGVMLGLTTAAAVRRGYQTIVDNIEQQAPAARLDGVLVAEMLDDGLDLQCGAVRLRSGDVALYGRTLDAPTAIEPVLALSPLSDTDALLLAHAVLTRVPVPALRRQTDPDVRGLAEVFMRIDALVIQTKERIDSIDLGPVRLVPERGYVTLDARIGQKAHLEGT